MAQNNRPEFEEAAEEELERIRRALDESRQRRKEATEAFDSFLRSFHQRPSGGPPPTRPIQPQQSQVRLQPRTIPAPPSTEHKLATAPAEAQGFDAAPAEAQGVDTQRVVIDEPAPFDLDAILPPVAEATDVVPTPPAAAEPVVPAALRSVRSGRLAARGTRRVAAFALLAGVIAVFAWRARAPGVSPGPPAVADPPAVQAPAQPPPPAASAPPTSKPAERLEAELTTLRPVWVRVLIDGERAIERELAAGQKIPLVASDRIAIRVGDAGALRISVGGVDQGPLGPDGTIATRTFTRPR